jgi:hypothetical protein
VATNRRLKEVLLTKLGVTPQRLSQRVSARKGELPMTTDLATYTIAHECGIDISKYLDRDTTREVRQLVSQLRTGRGRNANGGTSSSSRLSRQSQRPSVAQKNVKVTIAGADVGKIPALKQSHAEDAKRMSERVYPTLYIFENSVRDVIELVLKDVYGKDWWSVAVPGKVQATAAEHKKSESKDPWHSKRGGREIDYVFLNELWAIINHCWKDFKDLFPSKAWVESLITSDMNVSRRVLAHMTPLAADDIRNIEAAFSKWVKQLQAVDSKLP